MGLKIFISYAMKDSNTLRIPEIASKLQENGKIDKVHFWEGWKGYPDGNIVRFMETNITDSEIFLAVCTKESNKSTNCQKERDMAYFQNKRVIPLFENFKDVPPALQPYKGIDLKGQGTTEIVEELIGLINSIEPQLIKREDIVDKNSIENELEEISVIISSAIFENEKNVKINNRDYKVNKYKSSGVRYVDIDIYTFIEQNRSTRSKYAKMAREGKNIIWIIKNKKYYARLIENKFEFL